jgi:ribose transport system substrate-binding protein
VALAVVFLAACSSTKAASVAATSSDAASAAATTSSATSAAPVSTAGGSSAASGSAASGGTARGNLTASQTGELAQLLKTAEGPAPWIPPGPAVDVKSLAGKRIFALIDLQSVPFQTTLANGLKSAAAAANIKITVGDGGFVATHDIQLLQNAVHDKYDAIVLGEAVPATVAPALRQAKAAGIPVVSLLFGDPRAVITSENAALSGVADSTYCYTCSGAIAADQAIYETGGKVNAVVITDVGTELATDIQKGFQGEIAKYCPSTCKIKIDEVQQSNVAQAVTSAAQVAAQDSSVNVIFPGVDFMVAYITPVLKAAGADKRIMVLSTNADLAPMQTMAAGGSVKSDVGNPIGWDAWGAIDQAYRAMAGMPAAPDEKLPLRIFTPSNIATIDLTKDADTWYGPVDYRAEYKKLWGLS